MDEDIDDGPTARSLAALLVFAAEKAWHITKSVAQRIKPLVTPPPEMRVSARGTLYSGVVVIDRSQIIFGVVVASGYDPSSSQPLITSSAPNSTRLDLSDWAGAGDDGCGDTSWHR